MVLINFMLYDDVDTHMDYGIYGIISNESADGGTKPCPRVINITLAVLNLMADYTEWKNACAQKLGFTGPVTVYPVNLPYT